MKVSMKSTIITENFIIRDAEFGDYELFTEWERDREMVKYFAIDEGRTYEQVVTEGFELRNGSYSRDMTITDKNRNKGTPGSHNNNEDGAPLQIP